MYTTLNWVIAQTTQGTSGGNESAPFWANPQFGLYAILIVGVIFIFTSSGRADRQRQKKLKELLSNLKRGDKVQTIGGIIGSVVEARENDVVLKVDESTNTKIRVIREAIKSVVAEESAAQEK